MFGNFFRNRNCISGFGGFFGQHFIPGRDFDGLRSQLCQSGLCHKGSGSQRQQQGCFNYFHVYLNSHLVIEKTGLFY